MKKEIWLDAGITEYSYDPAGNLTCEKTPLGKIYYNYTYCRLQHKRYSDMTGNDVTYTYDNAGRLNEVLDGSGRQRLTYDALGNVTAEERTLAIPGNPYSYTFNMGYRHDSWGRMLGMTYPDGEEVTYDYLWGGDLETMTGVKESANHTYISNIQYNAFGQRCVVAYGNGTSASYSYDALHRLTTLTSVSSLGTMQQIDYTHDNIGNILSVNNSAGPVNGLGGTCSNTYIYDKINRLTQSENTNNLYALEMNYTPSGRIRHKSVMANATYHVFDTLFYGYCDGPQPHAPKRIYEKNRNILNDLIWDNAGNLGQVNTYSRGCPIGNRFLFWTEDNRLHTVVDEEYFSYYSYDHAGERTLKLTGRSDLMDINALLVSSNALLTEYTVYPSPYMVLSNRGYTKHYYIGADHLCARIGGGGLAGAEYNPRIENRATQLFNSCISSCEERVLNGNIEACIHGFGREEENLHIRETPLPRLRASAVPQPLETFAPRMAWYASHQDPETEVYFYHGDHLGGANWITDASGAPVQHLQYLPFGQPFVDRRVAGSSYSERYTFTGKERDEETGYGYFGARYMDHELMTMWLSVDPMADKYPSISPYAYCAWNPVKLVDPDGREIHIVGDKKYQAKVIALLNQLAKSGLAGKYLVSEALRSEKTFTFIQPRDNSSFEEDAINRNGKNGEISFILFDAYSSGTLDEANGGVEKTPLTTMAHELAHFVFPNNGHILMDNGYNGGPAGEVKAVEWENMVRADLGMPLRKKYAGMDVFGKELSRSKKYDNFYTLTKKENYMQRPKDVGGFRAPRENLKRINPYYSGSRIVNPPINSTECKFKL